jgi:hypothetical protein
VNCSAYPGITGCLCSTGNQGGLAECSPDSVKSTDEGFCCDSSFLCSCYRVACVSLPNIKSCDCGTPLDTSGTRVSLCTKPQGGVCCLDKRISPPYRCRCSGYDTACKIGETEVLSCAVADITDCGTGDKVARCK